MCSWLNIVCLNFQTSNPNPLLTVSQWKFAEGLCVHVCVISELCCYLLPNRMPQNMHGMALLNEGLLAKNWYNNGCKEFGNDVCVCYKEFSTVCVCVFSKSKEKCCIKMCIISFRAVNGQVDSGPEIWLDLNLKSTGSRCRVQGLKDPTL